MSALASKTKRALELLAQLHAECPDWRELIPPADAEALDWYDMLGDSAAWLHGYLDERTHAKAAPAPAPGRAAPAGPVASAGPARPAPPPGPRVLQFESAAPGASSPNGPS